MGAEKSKHGGQVISTSPQAVQPTEPPYPGPSAQYQFINVNVAMQHMASFDFYRGSMVCSNVDTYYPVLADLYRHGFRMLTFYHIPGQVQQAGGLFNPTVLMPFQGIFCRYPEGPPQGQYQLHIEKSIIEPQIVWNGILSSRHDQVTNTNHLFQTVINNAARGARLICIELTGQEQQHRIGYNPHLGVMGCDLFFEMPIGPPQETYIYNVVSEPIYVSVRGTFPPVPVVQCNWAGVLQANLGQGWKLVEIFLDESKSHQLRGFTANMQINSQWYFEKPASRINDPTPVYQGTLIEHEIVMKTQFLSGVKTTANWEPVIQDMGNKGWELACLLETPDQRHAGLGKAVMKVMLFFQRKIVPDRAVPAPYAQPPAAVPAPYAQPPAAVPPPYPDSKPPHGS